MQRRDSIHLQPTSTRLEFPVKQRPPVIFPVIAHKTESENVRKNSC